MKRRPTSVTVIAWILLVLNGIYLVASFVTIHDQESRSFMASSVVPEKLQYGVLYAGFGVEILCAIFMLRGANWARILYIGWRGAQLLFLQLTFPDMILPLPWLVMYAVFVFLLTRPREKAYFTQPIEIPNG
jgi:hypothetical protein